VLSHQYSTNIDFSENIFRNANKRVYYFYSTLKQVKDLINTSNSKDSNNYLKDITDNLIRKFEEAMNDNFNTAKVIADLSEVFKKINDFLTSKEIKNKNKKHTLEIFMKNFQNITKVLRLFDENPTEFLNNFKAKFLERNNMDLEFIKEKIAERNKARKAKDFTKSDAIRDELVKMKITLKDTPQGTEWDILFD